MKRLTLLLPLALVTGIIGATFLDDAGSRSPRLSASRSGLALPARAALPDHGAIVRVDVVYADGYVRSVPDALPTPTATVAATASATPPPTNTPRPTLALTPSVVPSKTPWPEMTATHEQATEIPGTPVPTPLPKPADCYAWVLTGLNVRASASIDAAKLGALPINQRIEINLVQVVQPEGSLTREEWGRIIYSGRIGWIALWHNGQELARLEDTPACWEIAS